MINSMKQLLCTPFKVILFLLLSIMSTALLVLSIHLWSDTNQKLNAMQDIFTTVATITQKEDSMVSSRLWDSALQMYSHYSSPVYNKVIPESVLDFVGGNYLNGPEKRPYYGAYMADYEGMFESFDFSDSYFIIEFKPVEDSVPNKPVLVNIVKVLSGESYGSKQLWYCDHYTENPEPLYAEKKYIACLSGYENTHAEAQIGTQIEFIPWAPIYSSQYDKSGVKLESKLNLEKPLSCEEVTKDFYQTGRGTYWLNFVETLSQIDKTVPVLPTESLKLLPAFHKGEAAIVDGIEITEKNFRNGDAVCLVTKSFAQVNNLVVGDVISLPLYFANYRSEPSVFFGYNSGVINFSLLNAQGETYSVFSEVEYEIVGTYRYNGGKAGGVLGGTEMARNMIIIPTKSVRASDENNIVDFGPMQEATTSFQIENGTIAEFEAAFHKAVPDSYSLLDIKYDDNGYDQISRNIKSTRNIAILLGAIGLLSTLAILILLLYFFVVRQKKRTAIERSLGLSRRQCRFSIISGIMILTILATTIGSIGSSVLINHIPVIDKTNQTSYSTVYSNWVLDEVDSKLIDKINAETPDTLWYIYIVVTVLQLLFMLISSVILVNRNLAIEPIMLLGTKGD